MVVKTIAAHERGGTQDVSLPEELLHEKFNAHLVHAAIKNELANKRQGNSSTKTRGEVRGTTKKPWRQKGTGNARAGSSKSPLWIGGGVIFGPQKRSYRYQLNSKVKKKAFRSLFGYLFAKGKIRVLDDLEVKEYKTKKISEIFSRISLKKRILLVIDCEHKNSVFLRRSARNLPWLMVVNVESLELNSLYNSKEIFFTKSSIEKLDSRLLKKQASEKQIGEKQASEK